MADAVETVTICPLCGGGEATRIAGGRDRLHRLEGEFSFVRCDVCSLVRLSPRPSPEALGSFYPESGYYSYAVESSAYSIQHDGFRDRVRDAIRGVVFDAWGYAAAPLRWWQRLLQPLAVRFFGSRAFYGIPDFPRFVPGGAALDVGCGSGTYLTFLQRHGWSVRGIEISAEAARRAKESFGIDVFTGRVEDAPFAPGSFDFIHMNHVLEHLPDPIGTLAHLALLLKPGGTLYVATPNIESDACRRCGEYWRGWDAPRHLFLFSPATLRRAAERAGLRVAELSTRTWPGSYAIEKAYRLEEERDGFLPDRSPSDAASRLRGRALDMADGLHTRLHPLEGQVLVCHAERARSR